MKNEINVRDISERRMKHRIRCAAIIERNGKILLVEHQDGKGNRWWIPPGGGLEDADKSILDCVRREVFEETGHQAEVGKLRYIREFIDKSNHTRHLELFYRATLGEDEVDEYPDSAPTLYDHMIVSAKWLDQKEMENIAVFPEVLKNRYWESKDGEVEYLGVSIESDDRQT